MGGKILNMGIAIIAIYNILGGTVVSFVIISFILTGIGRYYQEKKLEKAGGSTTGIAAGGGSPKRIYTKSAYQQEIARINSESNARIAQIRENGRLTHLKIMADHEERVKKIKAGIYL